MGEDLTIIYSDNDHKETGVKRHRLEDLSIRIIGAAIEVHRELGPGFLENIYEEALKIEFAKNDFKFESQKEIKVEIKRIVN